MSINFKSDIKKVLKQVRKKMNISDDALYILNAILNAIYEHIINQIDKSNKSIKTIENFKKYLSFLDTELKKHAISEISRCLIKKQTLTKKEFEKKFVFKIIFRESDDNRFLYIGSLLEYLCAELVEISSNHALKNRNNNVIDIIDIRESVKADDEILTMIKRIDE